MNWKTKPIEYLHACAMLVVSGVAFAAGAWSIYIRNTDWACTWFAVCIAADVSIIRNRHCNI